MKKHHRKGWFRFLVSIYVSAFCFLLVAALATGYLLSDPEYGWAEKTPFIRDLLLKYGLIVGLFLAVLYNTLITFSPCFPFMLYLKFKREYGWNEIIVDSFAYSAIFSWGLYVYIFWLLDAINDVYILLFRASPHAIIAILELWISISYYPILVIFFILFPIVYYLMKRSEANVNTQEENKNEEKLEITT